MTGSRWKLIEDKEFSDEPQMAGHFRMTRAELRINLPNQITFVIADKDMMLVRDAVDAFVKMYGLRDSLGREVKLD